MESKLIINESLGLHFVELVYENFENKTSKANLVLSETQKILLYNTDTYMYTVDPYLLLPDPYITLREYEKQCRGM